MARAVVNNEDISVDSSTNDNSSELPSTVKFKCLICGRYFISQSDFDEHSKSHSKDTRYKCVICEFVSKDSGSVLRHVGRKHPTILLKFKCRDCEEEFFSRKLLRQHKNEMHTGSHKCNFCDRIFDQKKRLTDHKKMRHSENFAKPYKCLSCERAFVYPHLLKRHEDRYKGECFVEGHTDGQPYVCEICKKTYVELDCYRKHYQLHMDCEFECPICHAPLNSAESLKLHVARHKEEEKAIEFKCEFCDKVYTKLDSLNYHLRHTHNTSRLYGCKVCGELRADRKELNAHKRNHFECIVCGKTFRNEDQLLKHKQRVCTKNKLSPEHTEIPAAYDQLFQPATTTSKKTIIRIPKKQKVEIRSEEEDNDDDSLDQLLFQGKLSGGSSSSTSVTNPSDMVCNFVPGDILDSNSSEIVDDLKELEDSVNGRYLLELEKFQNDSEKYGSDLSD